MTLQKTRTEGHLFNTFLHDYGCSDGSGDDSLLESNQVEYGLWSFQIQLGL